jgi:hypothetical protein
MVFTNVGKNKVRDLLSATVTHGVVGSDNTPATFNDTALLAQYVDGDNAVSKSLSDKQFVADYSLTATQLAGSTIAEFGLLTDDDELINRKVFTALLHDSTDQWQFSTRFFIN